VNYHAFSVYKESGVPWLGQIPGHWSAWRFSHAVSVNGGQVDPRLAPWSEMTLIAPNHIESGTGRLLATETATEQGADSGKYLIRKGQVIYSKIRPVLRKATLAPADCLSSADMYGLHPAAGLLRNRFLLEVVLSKPFTDFVIDASMRVAMPKINREALGAGTVWFPSLEEQDAILTFLDRETAQIDELIAKQNALIELLGERRKAVITKAVTKGLDPSVQMKDSGVDWLGDVPVTWTISALKRLSIVQNGVTLGRAADETSVELPYLRVANVQSDYVDIAEVKTVAVPAEDVSRYLLQSGDVLMTEGGDIDKLGRGCVWDGSIDPCLHQNHIFAVRCSSHLSNKFLTYLLDSRPGRMYFEITAKQATNLASTNSTTLGRFAFGLPSLDEQHQITDHLDRETARAADLMAKSGEFVAVLRERRSALVTAAVTGKIDVRGAA